MHNTFGWQFENILIEGQTFFVALVLSIPL
jgi:hypothetical protein